ERSRPAGGIAVPEGGDNPSPPAKNEKAPVLQEPGPFHFSLWGLKEGNHVRHFLDRDSSRSRKWAGSRAIASETVNPGPSSLQACCDKSRDVSGSPAAPVVFESVPCRSQDRARAQARNSCTSL